MIDLLLTSQADRAILAFFNGSDSLFLDHVVLVLTNGPTWIVFYLALFYMVLRNNETMPQIMLVVGAAACCVLFGGGVSDILVKPLVMQFRPTYDPQWKMMVDVAQGYTGSGQYGFFSAHAANTMAIAVFFSLLVRGRLFSMMMILWSLANAWSRLYLGVHYPSDVAVGLLWGAVVGLLVYLVYRKCYFKVSPRLNYISSQYTRTGYDYQDIDMVLTIMAFTLTYIVIQATIV